MCIIKPLYYCYQESSKIVTNEKEEARDLEQKGYYIRSDANGQFVMYRPSRADIVCEVDGERVIQTAKPLVREVYGVNDVTEQNLKEFLEDCKKGKVTLKFDGEYLYTPTVQ